MRLHKLQLVGLVFLSALGSPAIAAAQAVPTANNTYEIVDSSTGNCSYNVGNNYAEEDTCANTATTQRWVISPPGTGAGVAAKTGYYAISEQSGGTSNNVWNSDGDTAPTNGTVLYVNYETSNSAYSSFQFTTETAPYYEIVIDGGVYCVTGSTGTNHITLATCTAASNQLWKFVPIYTLTPSVSSLSVAQGSTATDTITLTDTTGFSGSVVLTTSTLPTGVTVAYSCSSNTITTSGSTCVLTFTATASATIGGPTTVTITGTNTTSGTITETTTIALTVSPKEYVFVSNGGGTVASLTRSGGSATSATSGGGIGAAVDSAGDYWSIATGGSNVSEFSNIGALSHTYTGTSAGISGATALTIDGNGIVWVANSGSVSALTNAGAAVSAAPVAQAGSISAPTSITVDTAGSLWLSNSGNGSVTEVIGIAAPVTAPVVTQVVNATPGTKP